MNRVNVITQLISATVAIPDTTPDSNISLAGILGSDIGPCQSVFIYSPLNDGIYNDNTLPIMYGGPEISAAIGMVLLPGDVAYIEIDNISKLYILEPSQSGTQILVVTISG